MNYIIINSKQDYFFSIKTIRKLLKTFLIIPECEIESIISCCRPDRLNYLEKISHYKININNIKNFMKLILNKKIDCYISKSITCNNSHRHNFSCFKNDTLYFAKCSIRAKFQPACIEFCINKRNTNFYFGIIN